jgi:hypothetical protein
VLPILVSFRWPEPETVEIKTDQALQDKVTNAHHIVENNPGNILLAI